MKRLVSIVTVILSLSLAAPAFSAETHTIDKQTAATKATERIPGRVISVSPEYRDATPVHRVKVLDARGGVHTVVIHGKTGEVLSAH